MWKWMKYFYLAIRLGSLWENLKAVNASDPATTAEDYQPAAAAVLDDPGVQEWMARLPLEQQELMRAGSPLIIWALDRLTEKL